MFVLRAITMLAFVVLLPAAAIMGLSLPGWMRELIEPSAVERQEPKTAHIDPAREKPGAAKKPASTVRNATAVADHKHPDEVDSSLPRSAEPPSTPWNQNPGAGNPNVASSGPPAPWRNAPGELPEHPHQPISAEPPPPPSESYPTTGIDPLVRTASAEDARGPVVPAAAPTASPEPRRDPQQSEFLEIQQRLQDLGATYYRLETWAGRSQFRFHCRMAVRDNSHYSRNFEATDADPMAAMRKVLEQVERWRAPPAPR